MRASAASTTWRALRSAAVHGAGDLACGRPVHAAPQALKTGAGSASSGSGNSSDQGGLCQNDAQIGAHRRYPCLLDREVTKKKGGREGPSPPLRFWTLVWGGGAFRWGFFSFSSGGFFIPPPGGGLGSTPPILQNYSQKGGRIEGLEIKRWHVHCKFTLRLPGSGPPGTTMERVTMSTFDNPFDPQRRLNRSGCSCGRHATRSFTIARPRRNCNAPRSRARTSATRASSPPP